MMVTHVHVCLEGLSMHTYYGVSTVGMHKSSNREVIDVNNVKSGLINIPLLTNLLLPKKMQFKNRWSPRINKPVGLPPINQPPLRKSIFLSNNLYFQFYLFPFVFFYLFLSSLLYLRFRLIIENFKKQLFPT